MQLALTAILVLGIVPCWSQGSPPIKQDAKNVACANIVALAGNVNVNCSILTPSQRALIESIPEVLNKILLNQLDPNAVMAKLDEIIANQKKAAAAITQIQQHTWRKLTDEEITQVASALLPFAGQKVSIVVSNPESDRLALAEQLVTVFRGAKWEVGGINTPMTFFSASTKEFPRGIILHVGQVNPAVQTIGNALIALFGRLNVPDGFNDEKFAKDLIEVNIWPTMK